MDRYILMAEDQTTGERFPLESYKDEEAAKRLAAFYNATSIHYVTAERWVGDSEAVKQRLRDIGATEDEAQALHDLDNLRGKFARLDGGTLDYHIADSLIQQLMVQVYALIAVRQLEDDDDDE